MSGTITVPIPAEEQRRIRLECCKLAAPLALNRGMDHAIATADALYLYVLTGQRVTPEPAQ